MRDTRQLLENWGNWSKIDRGEPEGLPKVSPMFQGANPKDMREPGWGEDESVPEDVPVPVNIPDAEFIDKIINDRKQVNETHALALTMAFACSSGRYKRPDRVKDTIDEAIQVIDNILKGGNKKALILDLHAKGKTAPKIAEIVGVSHQYVYQITICK